MKNRIFLILFIIFIWGCSSSKKIVIEGEKFEIDKVSNFIDTNEEFEMRIIEYIVGCNCGIFSCASNCLGITSINDTIRVLSLCNIDSSFKVGMLVNVIPTPKYNADIIGMYWVFNPNTNQLSIPEIHKNIFKTLYGKIEFRSK